MPATTLIHIFFPFAFTWGFVGLAFIPYFLPTIVALIRRSNSTGGVFLLNFFLGWTFIGWIGALVWAITSRNASTTVIVNNTYAAGSGQSYSPPPGYNPPPYPQEPTPFPYNQQRSTHQTSPTLRRPSANQPGPSEDRQDR